MTNLGSDDTPIKGQNFELPAGAQIDEESGDLVIRDSGGSVVFRRDEASGEWVGDSLNVNVSFTDAAGVTHTGELADAADVGSGGSSAVQQADYVVYKDSGGTINAAGTRGLTNVSGSDAATVIQNAITNLPSNDAAEHVGLVYITSGEYTIDSDITVYAGTRLVGSGPDHVRPDVDAGEVDHPFTRFNVTSNALDGIHPPNVNTDLAPMILVKGIAFDGPGMGVTGSRAITGEGYSNRFDLTRFEDCVFRDFETNIASGDWDSISIVNNHFYNAGSHSVDASTDSGPAEVYVRGNASWVQIQGDHYHQVGGCFMQNDLTVGQNTGIHGDGTAMVVGNAISGNGADQYLYDCEQVMANRFEASPNYHIRVTNNSKVGYNIYRMQAGAAEVIVESGATMDSSENPSNISVENNGTINWAHYADGYDVQVDGTDGTGIINFKTS